MPKGVYKRKDSMRKKMRQIRLGTHLSEKTKKKLSLFLKGKFGKYSNHWKGGRSILNGYMFVHKLNHPYGDMSNRVYEHRLRVEKFLKRYLLPNEICHHVDDIRHNNKLLNLMVFNSMSAHIRFHKNPQTVKLEEIIFDGRIQSNYGGIIYEKTK